MGLGSVLNLRGVFPKEQPSQPTEPRLAEVISRDQTLAQQVRGQMRSFEQNFVQETATDQTFKEYIIASAHKLSRLIHHASIDEAGQTNSYRMEGEAADAIATFLKTMYSTAEGDGAMLKFIRSSLLKENLGAYRFATQPDDCDVSVGSLYQEAKTCAYEPPVSSEIASEPCEASGADVIPLNSVRRAASSGPALNP